MLKFPFETNSFVVRRFEPQDLSAFLSFMLDDESTKYLMFDSEQKTEEGAKALFGYVCVEYESEDPIHSYAISEKGTNRYLGSCGFAPYDDGVFECYYSVNKAETGKGITSEVIKELVNELSQEVEVRAYCHPENYAAHAVAKKCMTPKGIVKHKNLGNESKQFFRECSG